MIINILVGYGDIVPATILGRFVGVIICLIGVLILSLIVVTLSLYTNLDKDEEEAYKDIQAFSTSYHNRIEIQNYVSKLLIYRFKHIAKKVDLDCVLDRNWRLMRKTKVKIELKKHHDYTYNEFIKNVRTIVDENMENLKKSLAPVWEIEEKVKLYNNLKKEEYLEINENITNVVRRSKSMMTSCMNLANSLVKIGGVLKLDGIYEVQHKKIIDDDILFKAKYEYLRSLVKGDDSYSGLSSDDYSQLKYTGIYPMN